MTHMSHSHAEMSLYDEEVAVHAVVNREVQRECSLARTESVRVGDNFTGGDGRVKVWRHCHVI